MKILYLSHVRWGWIKQRPHFIAEGLACTNLVDYYFYQSRSHQSSKDYTAISDNPNLHLQLKSYFLLPFERIPFIGMSRFFEKLNWWFMRLQLPRFKDYDIIWISHPTIYPKIKCALRKNNHIVYDCMDDMIAFPEVKNDPKRVAEILKTEKEILLKNSIVFCSSDYLAKTILRRAGVERKVCIVNNAIELPQRNLDVINNMPEELKQKYEELSQLTDVFMYIGTVSEWFDFEKIEQLLKEIPSVNVVLIGPAYATKIPDHPRIHCFGPMDRKFIFPFMEKAKALIMPFVVNELIESVNPVKLYEYIYSGKPSIASHYSETEKFKNFVCLYDNYEELKNISLGIVADTITPRSQEEINDYVNQNTWAERIKSVEKELSLVKM